MLKDPAASCFFGASIEGSRIGSIYRILLENHGETPFVDAMGKDRIHLAVAVAARGGQIRIQTDVL